MGWAFSQKSSHFQKIRPELITIQNRLNSPKIPHNTRWAWKPKIHHQLSRDGLKSTKIYCFTDWAEKTMLLHHKDQAKKSTTFFIKALEPLSVEGILHSKGELGHWVTRPTSQPPTPNLRKRQGSPTHKRRIKHTHPPPPQKKKKRVTIWWTCCILTRNAKLFVTNHEVMQCDTFLKIFFI